MKIALAHDYLNQLGGGERVLDELLRIFPDAKIYTLLYDEQKTLGRYKSRVASTSFLDVPLVRNHHRPFIPAMPFAAQSIRIPDDVDVLISDSAGFAKGVRYNRAHTKHICYVHTPVRYAWETATYFNGALKDWIIKLLGAPAFAFLRWWDRRMAERPDILLANSQYIAEKIQRYYGRFAQVIYPPISDFWSPAPTVVGSQPTISNSYYLAAGRLLHYKRFDLIIDAFAQLRLPLKIAGSGPEFKSLESRIKLLTTHHLLPTNSIQLLGYVSDEELRELYRGAKAFVMANEEDFGLVMAEALACGTSVIAYNAGGAKEIVNDQNGVLFNEQTSGALIAAVQKFEQSTRPRTMTRHSTRAGSGEVFYEKIKTTITAVMK